MTLTIKHNNVSIEIHGTGARRVEIMSKNKPEPSVVIIQNQNLTCTKIFVDPNLRVRKVHTSSELPEEKKQSQPNANRATESDPLSDTVASLVEAIGTVMLSDAQDELGMEAGVGAQVDIRGASADVSTHDVPGRIWTTD